MGMSIGGSYSYINANNYNSIRTSQQLTSGKTNQIGVDPAGTAIANQMANQVTGNNVASNNAADMKNLYNIADGGMDSINQSLGRIRELGVQAKSGQYTSSDRSVFQKEIDGLKEHINQVAGGTNYNGKPLLDGSFQDQKTVVGANGQTTSGSISSSYTDSLGISDFDVTGDFDLKNIDKAIEGISTERAKMGAATNALEYSERLSDNQAINLEQARSRKEDTDMASAMSDKKRQEVTEQLGLTMMKKKMETSGNFLQLLA